MEENKCGYLTSKIPEPSKDAPGEYPCCNQYRGVPWYRTLLFIFVLFLTRTELPLFHDTYVFPGLISRLVPGFALLSCLAQPTAMESLFQIYNLLKWNI